MKEIALVADMHGNWPATLALDADLKRRGIKEIWCLGDAVGKGPSGAQTLDWALENCSVMLRGNWEDGIGRRQFAKNDQYHYKRLGEKRMRMLLEFPLEHHAVVSGKRMRLLHGRPVMEKLLWPFDDEERALPLFQPDFDIVGYADCHRASLRVMEHINGLLFNTGSVGNGLGIPMAQYAIMRFEAGEADLLQAPAAPLDIRFVLLPYDQAQAVRDAMADDELPMREAYIQEITTGRYGRVPPASK